MKALYIPTGILVLLLIGSLASAAYVHRQIDASLAPLLQAETFAREESWSEAEHQLQLGYDRWLAGQGYFHAIVEHGELDESETLFAAAFAACDEQDEADFHAILAQLRTSLEHLSEKQQLSLGNIL